MKDTEYSVAFTHGLAVTVHTMGIRAAGILAMADRLKHGLNYTIETIYDVDNKKLYGTELILRWWEK